MAFNPQTINKELDMANLAKHNANYSAIKTELDTHDAHVAAQAAHGSTPAATAGKIMQRDSAGRAKVSAPSASDDIARKAEVDAVQANLDVHEADSVAHLTIVEHTKLTGIEEGAEVNQNAFAQVNNVVAGAKSETLTIAGGTGITVTTNPTTKTVTVTATGDATPGAHGSSHNIDGADPIPDLVALDAQMTENTFEGYNGKRYIITSPYRGGSLSLKGQLHCHTTNSDAVDSPVNLVTAYKNAGYDFITITDHNFITPNPGVEGITWIGNSVEETYARHIVAYDIDERITNSNFAQDVINFHAERGKLTNFAHPNWPGRYTLDKIEAESVYGMNFTEVYNAVVGEYCEEQWDLMLSAGRHVFALASDDCHSINSAEFNKGWVVVKADANTKADILSALRSGNFYASTGNNIAISVVGNQVNASSTNVSDFVFIGDGGRVLKTVSSVSSASYTILGDERYVRVKVVKKSDETLAWSNPVFVDVISDDDKNASESFKASFQGANKLINSNFDIWQRGVSWRNAAPATYTADRWFITSNQDGFVFPANIDNMRVSVAGELMGSSFGYRLSVDGAGSGIGAGTSYGLYQRIENGTRYLCGSGRKITVTFWARSSIAGKRIGVSVNQRYGTGGSPSANEPLYAPDRHVFELESYFKKFTVSINTNTFYNKVFGTNNDDYLQLGIHYIWGETEGAYRFGPGAGTELFKGAGVIDIAQVQLSVGDKEVPYDPRPVAEELQMCQRYCQSLQNAEKTTKLGFGLATSTTSAQITIPLPTTMRAIPTLSINAPGDFVMSDGVNFVSVTGVILNSSDSSKNQICLTVTTAGGLTQFRAYFLEFLIWEYRSLVFSAEL